MGRQGEYPVQVEDIRGQVCGHRVGQAVATGVRPDIGRVRLLDADPDERQAAIPVALEGVAQDRCLRLTGGAPGGPEIDPDALAAQIGQANRPTVHVGQRPGRPIGAGSGQLRRQAARPQAHGRRSEQVGGWARVTRARASDSTKRPCGGRQEHGCHDENPGHCSELAPAERTNHPVALGLVFEAGALFRHQIADRNVK